MPRRQKKVKRGGRRRLQGATAGLYTLATGGALAAKIADTYIGPKLGWKQPFGGKRGNLRGTPNGPTTVRRFPSTMRANSEGYIPNISHTVGNAKKGLSFTERIQKVINPPQTLMYNATGRIDATSGLQSVTSFTIDNSFFANFFDFYAALRSDSNAGSGIVEPLAASNTVNHLWTSIQHTFMNSGTNTVEFDVYVFRALQDCGSADQTLTAASTWSYAEQLNGAVGIAVDGATRIGKKPSDTSARFVINRYWRCVKKNSITMKPGESFKHYYCEHYNKQYAKFMLQGDNAGITKQHSLSYVFVLKGQVVGSNIAATVSTGDAQLSYVRTTKLSHCQANNVRPRDLLIGTDLATIAPANQLIINTDTGLQKTIFEEDV